MADIRHRVGIRAPQPDVYEKLSTTAGIASWWTRDTVGDAAPGGRFEVYFGSPEPSAVIEVVAADPENGVVWRVVEGPDEWLPTRFVVALLTPRRATMTVAPVHAMTGWREPVRLHRLTPQHEMGVLPAGPEDIDEGRRGGTPCRPASCRMSSWG